MALPGLLIAVLVPRASFLAAPLVLVLFGAMGACDVGDPSVATGEIVWTLPKQNPLDNSVRPLIADGVAYIAHDRQLLAVDSKTGEERWRRPVPSGRPGNLSSRALVGDADRVYLNDAGWVGAFRKADGALQWDVEAPGAARDLQVMGQDDRSLYLGMRGIAVRVAKADGAVGAVYPLTTAAGGAAQELAGDVAISDAGIVVVPVGWAVPGDSVTIRGAVYGFDAASGRQLWVTPAPLQSTPDPLGPGLRWRDVGAEGAVVHDGVAYVTTTVQMLALDTRTGDLLWTAYFGDDGGFYTGLTYHDGFLYAGAVTQVVVKVDAADGSRVWRHAMDGSLVPIITVTDGKVYFTNGGWGELWVLDDVTGRPLWNGRPPTYRQDGAVYQSSVAVGEDRMVVVGNRAVYGLGRR